jgi:peroxiredoxin Q/BCP
VIKEYDVEYFMISTDKLEDNTAFAKQENADFPILADPTQKTATAYGVLRDYGAMGKLANRWTFYIGPEGKILAIDKAVKPGQAGEALITELKELKVPPKKH